MRGLEVLQTATGYAELQIRCRCSLVLWHQIEPSNLVTIDMAQSYNGGQSKYVRGRTIVVGDMGINVRRTSPHTLFESVPTLWNV